MHILYLDDDPRMESTLRRIVRRHGHSFEFCTSIQTCKIAVLALTPDLLLLDLGLGQESGLDLIEWLAITKQRIPVAFLSGYGDDLLDTAQRIAKARGIEVRGLVSKALLANDLMPLLNPHQPLQPLQHYNHCIRHQSLQIILHCHIRKYTIHHSMQNYWLNGLKLERWSHFFSPLFRWLMADLAEQKCWHDCD
ncbi:response regulator [Chromatium okenii]|uniref:Response regulatory domain-containing protein n=1 Tax=Chromatium okenii TaxID=61644 RepID=A0A2S7XQ43_9GAMM|nr:response regulator [Chromatium okenii]PQJ95857.1 hypothetical protein CXB77_11800 [Chromatium okenii]